LRSSTTLTVLPSGAYFCALPRTLRSTRDPFDVHRYRDWLGRQRGLHVLAARLKERLDRAQCPPDDVAHVHLERHSSTRWDCSRAISASLR
jgi:hypothetical protein